MQKDGKLNRMEFCALCNAHLGHMSTDLLDLAVQNMKLAKECSRKRNLAYWVAVANTLESWARVVVPSAYMLSLGILFHLTFTDDYLTGSSVMFSGFGNAHFSIRGVLLSVVSGVVLVSCVVGYVLMKRIDFNSADASAAEQAQAAKDAGNVAETSSAADARSSSPKPAVRQV